MGISSRHYLFLEDGSLRRVPRRVLHGLPFGMDAIPEFAGTRQRQADVVLENEGGKPVRILDVRGSFWIFDAEGKIDQGLVDGMGDWMRLVRDEKTTRREGVVVDLVPELKQKEMRDKLRWTPTADEVDRIAADIWPGVHGPAPAVESVKGVVPKKPPVSYRAKDALSAIAREIGIIEERLRSLGEADLKGLIFEAHRTGSFQDEAQAMWSGVAAEAERRQKIAAAKRTGRGEWYAVIEAMRLESEHIIASIATAHVKGSSRKDAIAKGRVLLREKADWLSEGIEIEVRLYPALEWQPVD